MLDYLLYVTATSKGDPQALYAYLKAHLEEIGGNFATLLENWAQTTLIQESVESTEVIIEAAKIIASFSNLIYEFSEGNRENNLEIALAGYKVADSLFIPETFPSEWAKTQNNLGNVYGDRIRGDKEENIEKAILYYKRSLQVYTQVKFPVEWAKAQNNLGNIYGDRIRGNKAENIEMAIFYYEAALDVLTSKDFPFEWAQTQNNLGTTYIGRIQGDKAKNIEIAIAAYKKALQIYTRKDFPFEWAWSQSNLGDAYSNRLRGDASDNLEVAIDYYQAALQVRKYEVAPIEWARTKNNLGNAYSNRMKGNKADNIEMEISCYEAAIQVYNFEIFPICWASSLYNLGKAYSARIKGNKAENIEIAIVSYQAALRVYTCEAFPADWASTQNQLGNSYCERIKENKAENLELAISSYQAALQVLTCETFPYEWATIQNNLGNVYANRIKGDKVENIELGIRHFHATLQVYSRQAFPDDWARTHNNLGNAYGERIRGDKSENLEVAINCFKEALQVYCHEESLDWARTHNNLGNCYLSRIKGNRENNLENAINCCQNALKYLAYETFPYEWAMAHNNLGNCYLYRIKGDREDNLENAISCCQNALRVFTFQTFPYEWAKTHSILGSIFMDRIKGDRIENLEAALLFYQSALKVYTYDVFSYDWSSIKNSLGVIHFYKSKLYEDNNKKLENLELAIKEYSVALKVRNREDLPQDYIKTAFNLGIAYQDEKQFKLAYDSLNFALETVELLRGEIISGEESKQKLAEQWNSVYSCIIEVCLELSKKIQAIEYVERSKTRSLVEQILGRDLKTIFPTEVITQLEQYRDEIATGQYQIQQGKAENPKILSQHLQQLRQQRNELQNRYLPVGSGFQFEQFQHNLDDHTAIVEFYITGDQLLTFIFTRQIQSPIVQKFGAKDLNKLAKWTIGYLRAYDNHKTWQLRHPQTPKESPWQRRLATRLHLLAKILHIDEIIQYVPKECDQLIVIPHRHLHLFPLHALPINSQQGEGTSGILMHRFPAGVSYAPSCQLLQLAQTRKRPDFTHLFAIQNPTDDLVFTDLEVEAIQSLFQTVEVLASQDASEAAVKVNQNLTTAHCSHFSCHGYFNPESPLESALVLAEAKSEQITQDKTIEDGFLTLGEIFGFNLNQCRLVTLSACETGLIDPTNISDEYIGLPSGFLVAGSPAVVSSLWTVNDLSTALLMIKFYENLHHQMSLAVALNQAQLWLRDATRTELAEWIKEKNLPLSPTFRVSLFRGLQPDDKPFNEPFHWAAFCAIGQ